MREDVRLLIARLLDETRADEAVLLAENADGQLRRETARLGGKAEFDYHLLTHRVASASARAEAITEVAEERRTVGTRVGDPGPSIVGPLHTR
jgi:hypothetical protein